MNKISILDTNIPLNEPGTLKICSYREFEPVIYANGKGFEADILKSIAVLWNVTIHFFLQDTYADIWEMPEKFDFDIAAGGITPEKDRRDSAIYSKPTATYSQSLLIRQKDYQIGKIRNYESFKNTHLKIGVVPDSAGETYGIKQAHEYGISSRIFVHYKSEKELVPALLKGEIDAIARGEIGNDYQAKKNPELMTIARKNFGEYFCFALAPKNQKLLKCLNDALDLITNNGQISYKEWSEDSAIFQKRATKQA